MIKLPRMNEDEVSSLLEKQMLCRIAFRGNHYPYVAPFQYTIVNGILYFHFTNYGRKMKLLGSNKGVCVEIEKYKQDLSEYRFVILRGELEVVIDSKERVQVIKKMAREGKAKLSRNFLAAHGLSRLGDWSSLEEEENAVIVRLQRIVEKIGLKSP